MVIISTKDYNNAEVSTITITNKTYFWVRMIDVQNGLDTKNLSDLVRKEIHDIFETEMPTEE